MELKDFIKNSVQSIIDATKDLAESNDDTWINPTIDSAGRDQDFARRDGAFVPITKIDFDVAVTEGSSDSGGAGVKINVMAASAKLGGELESNYSNVSRLRFSMRVALPSEKSEERNWSSIGSAV